MAPSYDSDPFRYLRGRAKGRTGLRSPMNVQGGGGPTFLRNMATRCRVPAARSVGAGFTPFMARHMHYARGNIINPALVFPNWYVTTANTDTVSGAALTLTASIEYPIGVFTQVTFGGLSSVLVASGDNAVSDAIMLVIPDGALFGVRSYGTTASGTVVYFGADTVIGDCMEFGASASDKTMGGTITPSSAPPNSITYGPVAIVAMTSRKSVFLYGDSRVQGMAAFNGTAQGDKGEFEPSFGASVGYLNGATGGTTTPSFTAITAAKRIALVQAYCSHVICNYGINDLVAGASAATLKTRLEVSRALFTGMPFYLSTIPPKTTSTDGWITVVNQTADPVSNGPRITHNTTLRSGGFTTIAGYFDVTSAVESSLNSGLWGAGYCYNDGGGLHESAAGVAAIVAFGAVNPNVLT